MNEELNGNNIRRYYDLKMDVENLQTICYCESEGVTYNLFEGPDHKIWYVISYTKIPLHRMVCMPIRERL